MQDKKIVSNTINKYYTNVAPNLEKNLPKAKINYKFYLRNPVAESFFCQPTNDDEII